LSILQKTETKVFKIKADIYVGCMHWQTNKIYA
jgi:hypothetical protein